MRAEGIAVAAVLLTTLLAAGVVRVPSDTVPGKLDVTTDKCSYAVGENVTITFANVGNTTIWWPWLGYPGGIIPYSVFDERGDLVWETSGPPATPSLSPGETSDSIWNQTYGVYGNPRRGQVDPGAYRIHSRAYHSNWTATTEDTTWIWIGEPCGTGAGKLDISTNKCSYAVGEDVAVTFANVGGTPIGWGELGFESRIPYTIYDEQGGLVWANRASGDYPHNLTPGQTYTHVWNQTYGGNGNPRHGQVDVGAYRITATADIEVFWGNITEDTEWIRIGEPCGSGPTAEAGPDVTIPEGGTVRLDGSASRGSTVRSSGGLPRIDNYSCGWNGLTGYPSDPVGPYVNLARNGGFERNLDEWTSVGSVSLSRDTVHGGSSSLLVNTTSSTEGYVQQRIGAAGSEYVLFAWVRTASTGSDPMVLELISNESIVGSRDIAVRLELFPDRIEGTVWDLPFITVLPNHLADPGWHRLVLAQNASAKMTCVFVDDTYAWAATRLDATPFSPEFLRVGDVSANGNAGAIYFDDLVLVGSAERTTEANITLYRWDLNDRVDSDGDGNFTDDADATGPVVNATYGDDGMYNVTLEVTDSANATATDTAKVTVLNTNPRIVGVHITPGTAGDLGLRVAGRKWNTVNLTLYADGTAVANASVTRMPGSPDDQIAWVHGPFEAAANYTGVVTYEPMDLGGQEVGGNPVWLVAGAPDNFTVIAHHTFNVQQSENRNSSHWNHIDPWTVDLTGRLSSSRSVIVVDAVDNGSDDLTFLWGNGVTHAYFNDGVGPDPPDSPWGTFPFTASDRLEVDVTPGMTIILTVLDDDGGSVTVALTP